MQYYSKIVWYAAVYITNIFWQIPNYVHSRFENSTLWEFYAIFLLSSRAEDQFGFHVPGEQLSTMDSESSRRRPPSKLQAVQATLIYGYRAVCWFTVSFTLFWLISFTVFICIQRLDYINLRYHMLCEITLYTTMKVYNWIATL